MKACSKCGQEKPLYNFGMHKGKPRSCCKVCKKAQDLDYKARNAAKIAAYMVDYKNKNLDRVKAQLCEWHLRNKERRNARCRELHRKRSEDSPEHVILMNIKNRAKKIGVEFDLKDEDIVIPKICPVLGIKIERRCDGKKGPLQNSPSVDRIDPKKGYVSSNIRIISYRANTIRNNATVDELEMVLKYARSLANR